MERLKGEEVKLVFKDEERNKVKRGVLDEIDDDFLYIIENGNNLPTAISRKVVVSVAPSNGGR